MRSLTESNQGFLSNTQNYKAFSLKAFRRANKYKKFDDQQEQLQYRRKRQG